uniref:SH3 domain-containing protein n=1 Tax=Lotharella oceanica TaxID=641309 RepID=A0A7S2X8U0_9EUKA|mmetsp:Transcript_20537/g.38619  ORF Transcript_20537/g.38619 Transcript_20537/m.38619 type:complete len:320 (+) Transcript_20537:252-1211(+)
MLNELEKLQNKRMARLEEALTTANTMLHNLGKITQKSAAAETKSQGKINPEKDIEKFVKKIASRKEKPPMVSIQLGKDGKPVTNVSRQRSMSEVSHDNTSTFAEEDAPEAMDENVGVALMEFWEEVDEEKLFGFSTNDKINITDKSNSDWWKGEIEGKEGFFPAPSVRLLGSTPRPFMLNAIYEAIWSFKSEREDELDLKEGDLLYVIAAHSGWCIGHKITSIAKAMENDITEGKEPTVDPDVASTAPLGTFPAECVRAMEEDEDEFDELDASIRSKHVVIHTMRQADFQKIMAAAAKPSHRKSTSSFMSFMGGGSSSK